MSREGTTRRSTRLLLVFAVLTVLVVGIAMLEIGSQVAALSAITDDDAQASATAATETAQTQQTATAKAATETVQAQQTVTAKAATETAQTQQTATAKAATETVQAQQTVTAKAATETAQVQQTATAKAVMETAQAQQMATAKAATETTQAEQAAAAKATRETVRAQQTAAKAATQIVTAKTPAPTDTLTPTPISTPTPTPSPSGRTTAIAIGMAGLVILAVVLGGLVIAFRRRAPTVLPPVLPPPDVTRISPERELKPTVEPPSPAPGQPYLQSKADPTLRLMLDKEKLRLGRAADSDLIIDDRFPGSETVSSHHARLMHDQQRNRWIVIDENSRNGVFVQGHRTGENVLHAGDSVCFGQVEFVFQVSG